MAQLRTVRFSPTNFGNNLLIKRANFKYGLYLLTEGNAMCYKFEWVFYCCIYMRVQEVTYNKHISMGWILLIITKNYSWTNEWSLTTKLPKTKNCTVITLQQNHIERWSILYYKPTRIIWKIKKKKIRGLLITWIAPSSHFLSRSMRGEGTWPANFSASPWKQWPVDIKLLVQATSQTQIVQFTTPTRLKGSNKVATLCKSSMRMYASMYSWAA